MGKNELLRLLVIAGLLVCIPGGAFAQRGAQPAVPVKLYIFDCGTLKSGNPAPLLERGVTTTDMSVTAYLIVHPAGTLMWDTCVILDDLIQSGGTTDERKARPTLDSTRHHRVCRIEKVAGVL